ncbi:MAG TPA: hypothetical protein VGP04_07935, partial [Pseudonocardiaceae bacterium]|nr:hypothetical protein [Pseudonocardiaceae bacterium]
MLDDVLSIACDNTEQHPKNRSKRTTPAGIRQSVEEAAMIRQPHDERVAVMQVIVHGCTELSGGVDEAKQGRERGCSRVAS